MAYATPSDLKDRFDQRTLGDLASVNGTRTTASALANDTRVLTALADASGEMDSAVKVARRYTPAQLAALTGDALAHLKRITCDIAFYLLIDRKVVGVSQEEFERRYKVYRSHLDDLRKGIAIFGVEEAMEAGLVSTDGPSSVQIENMNYITGRARGHYYPRRILPGNR